ncbi:fructosamine kinase family protein [Marinobacter nanhaiticus D15-8W]|uniref:Fructosamine kinase n=1 Tax=Marinobacter nanhaiticus D15-8W TaxID=626887 RepID=N6X6Q4_9GAMM|nr:fructosamine kinase family protein [Marinobacter nanhaiticus]ENO16788.1 fructosamine kinase [Marinobacter nanhaiticus D15-8W]BES72603.1 fructosamine kinase family protein [Marinobacter nanhaiticus D15-8W]
MASNRILQDLLAQAGLPDVSDGHDTGGGSFGGTSRLTLTDGREVFLKTQRDAPAGFFQAEALGLQALAETNAIHVPEVLAVSDSGLLMEWLSGSPASDYAERLGEQLATLHRHTSDAFGFEMDNFCGLTPQPNPRMADGFAFFAEARLEHQARLAQQGGLLQSRDIKCIEAIASRLQDWIPEQPASLIHGDLWSGNVHCGPSGEPVLIDPAAHYGWAEADLAMTTLFGRQAPAFYQAYAEAADLDPDWEERIPLYNLYHLLNHLNLFGGGYLSSVRAVLDRFG